MSDTPFMPLFIGDFVADVMELSPEEIGCYTLLLSSAWTKDGYLHDDPRKMAYICKVTPTRFKRRIWPALSGYFVSEGGFVWNPRLLKELTRARAASRQNAIAGRRGGLARTAKEREARGDEVIDPRRSRLLAAFGVLEKPVHSSGHIYGNHFDMMEATLWERELGLTLDEQCAVIEDVMSTYQGQSPPHSFRYFSAAMERFAGTKNRPPLTPRPSPQKKETTHDTGLRKSRPHAQSAYQRGFLGEDPEP